MKNSLLKSFSTLKDSIENMILRNNNYSKDLQDTFNIIALKIQQLKESLTDNSSKCEDMQQNIKMLNTRFDNIINILENTTKEQLKHRQEIDQLLEKFKNIPSKEFIEGEIRNIADISLKNTSEILTNHIENKINEKVQYIDKKINESENNVYQKLPDEINNIMENLTQKIFKKCEIMISNSLAKIPEYKSQKDYIPEKLKQTDISVKSEPRIVQIDTDKIRARILDAVNKANSIDKNIKYDKFNPYNLISEAKLGVYKMPFFFDGERIFGIYNPDQNTNLITSEMNIENMLANNENMQHIHINPLCSEIKDQNFEITYDDKCKIHYTHNGEYFEKEKSLNICQKCIDKLYDKQNTPKTFNDFINDFVSGNLKL